MTARVGWRPALSVEAERAIRTLNRVVVHITSSRTPLRHGTDARADINELGFVRAFSCLESYLTTRADTVLRDKLPVPDPPKGVQAYAHLRLMDGFRGSFDSSARFWSDGYGLAPGAAPKDSWSKIGASRDLRNLLTHALGYVRPGGDPLKKSIAERLRSVTRDPRTFTGRVPVSDKDFDELAEAVLVFIIWFDAQTT